MTDPEIIAGLKQLRAATTSLNGYDSLALLPRELHTLDAAIARLSATCWQPIETAQMDGTSVIVAHRACIFVAAFAIEWTGHIQGATKARWQSECCGRDLAPTHWMPLPHTPRTEEP